MKDYLLNKLTTALWTAIVLVLVVLASYASLGRLVTSNLGQYREDLLRELNARLSFVVEVDELRGEWSSFTPRVEFKGVRLLGDRYTEHSMVIDSLYAEIDVLDSLRTRSLQFYALSSVGMRMHVDIDEQGRLTLPGLPAQSGGNFGSPLYDLLFNAELMEFSDVTISLNDAEGERQLFAEVRLAREDDFRRFNLSLLSPARESWFRVIAEGTGDLMDLPSFVGDFHLVTSIGDVANYQVWSESLGIAGVAGGMNAELWMSIRDGEMRLAAELGADNLSIPVSGESTQSIEFSDLGGNVQAAYSDGRWRFDLEQLSFQRDQSALRVERLGGEYDGKQLRLLSKDLDLDDFVVYFTEDSQLPPAAYKLLTELAPRGTFERLQITLPDVSDLSAWQLDANFAGVSVESVSGAPGITNASGYLSMGPETGKVQIASSEFTMSFPAVFRAPLAYSSFSAELAWQLEEEEFRVWSGPFDAAADEGLVRGLFGLSVPLQKPNLGIDMDLMVGFSDTHPRFRAKYLPYTLSDNLLGWLGSSIGDGHIDEGAFIWRGHLRRELPERRTVQLFFDVEDATLNYHPEWPPAHELDGLVLIDGPDVDVRASDARIIDTRVRELDVQLRSDDRKQLQLSIEGVMEGDAEDGLTVVNTSPLRKIVGDTFVDWQLAGSLETRLKLQLNLSDNTVSPRVSVDTQWDRVTLDAAPLRLQVEDISGDLHFDMENGFSADALIGSLWGAAVTANVTQGRVEEQLADLDIAVSGVVSAASVREWLQLDLLRLAEGEASVDLNIILPNGGGPYLQAQSDLQGVSLDLPAPWGKSSETAENFSVHMPLGGESRRLSLDLDQTVWLGVLLDENGYAGASLGFGEPLTQLEAGYFLLGGELEQLRWQVWSDFLDRYVLSEGQSPAAVLVGVRDLRVGQLEAFGQNFSNVQLNAWQETQRWDLEATTDWVKGRVSVPDDWSSLSVDLARLDLEGFSEELNINLEQLPSGSSDLPPIAISIAELSNGADVWGNVSFNLREEEGNYSFEDVRGNLRGLELGSEGEGMRVDWLAAGDTPKTHVQGEIYFEDFGLVLENYSYDKVIETRQGEVGFDVNWPGSPLDFQLATSSGTVAIDVGEGSFLKTSGATEGTPRVVSILNLADFVRRLSLDLSYMFKSGIPFDSIRGDLHLQDGTIEVPDMAVAGPSSSFQFAGRADVPEQRIDGELVATLPIASNLPWVAALVSGLPAAVAVYVFSKLFTKQMDRFSSASYEVAGPWDDPEVKFQRIFDNTTEANNVASTEATDPADI